MSDKDSILDRVFQQWAGGRDPVRSRIAIFEKIRDIPYAIMPDLIDSEKYIEILKIGRGSCSPKHLLMAEMYKRLGLLVLFVVYAYSWSERAETVANFPRKLKAMAKNQPLGYHLACKVEIDGKLVVVDATLDAPLVKAEFLPVNLHWDGFSDTLLPMTPIGDEIVFHPLEAKLIHPRVDKQSREFYEEVNRRLEDIRRL